MDAEHDAPDDMPGNFVRPGRRQDPSRIDGSHEATPAASTRSSTSLGPGLGTSFSRTLIWEGEPKREIAAAFITGGMLIRGLMVFSDQRGRSSRQPPLHRADHPAPGRCACAVRARAPLSSGARAPTHPTVRTGRERRRARVAPLSQATQLVHELASIEVMVDHVIDRIHAGADAEFVLTEAEVL